MTRGDLDRRRFLQSAGSGLIVLFSLPSDWAEAQGPARSPRRPSFPTDPDETPG